MNPLKITLDFSIKISESHSLTDTVKYENRK
jgi:hypothetical protein